MTALERLYNAAVVPVVVLDDAADAVPTAKALLAGGVASSTLLRGMLLERAKKTRLGCKLCFARPELSGDNAVGVALLGAEAYRAERRLHG